MNLISHRYQFKQRNGRRGAQEVAKLHENSLVIYIDGSEIHEKLGAAVVAPHRMIRAYLGSSTAFTVYSTELYGIILATVLAHISGNHKTHVIICIDNQATIRAVENSGNSSGQHLVKNIVKLVNILP